MTLDLDERYGRTKTSTGRTRLIAIIVGGFFVVVLVAWVVWGGLFAPASQLEVDDTGHVLHDSSVDVKFQLTIEPGTAAKCAVQALNAGFTVIGWKIVDVPASTVRVRPLVESVATTEPPVTGLIYRCWVA